MVLGKCICIYKYIKKKLHTCVKRLNIYFQDVIDEYLERSNRRGSDYKEIDAKCLRWRPRSAPAPAGPTWNVPVFSECSMINIYLNISVAQLEYVIRRGKYFPKIALGRCLRKKESICPWVSSIPLKQTLGITYLIELQMIL